LTSKKEAPEPPSNFFSKNSVAPQAPPSPTTFNNLRNTYENWELFSLGNILVLPEKCVVKNFSAQKN
jgi:hypothetical protein